MKWYAKPIYALVALAPVLSLGIVAGRVEASPGTHYYVNAATGDDLFGDGSAANPWKTITHASATVPAGASAADPNVIHVAAGLYDKTNSAEGFTINFNSANVALGGAGAVGCPQF